MLIVAPLALLSSTGGGSAQITSAGGAIPAGLVPVFNEAAARLRRQRLPARRRSPTRSRRSAPAPAGARSTAPAASASCRCASAAPAATPGTPPSTPTAAASARPATASRPTGTPTCSTPSTTSWPPPCTCAARSADARSRGSTALAYRALCGYYGACSDGIAGNYAADVLDARPRLAARSRRHARHRRRRRSARPARWPGRCAGRSPRRSASAAPGRPAIPASTSRVPSGTPILAAAAGRVSLVQSAAGSGGYGNFTCLQHTSALSTCYAHQQRFLVHVGEIVGRGQPIGISDCTGRCYGPHLHFEVRLDDQPVCPAPLPRRRRRARCAPRGRPAHDPRDRASVAGCRARRRARRLRRTRTPATARSPRHRREPAERQRLSRAPAAPDRRRPSRRRAGDSARRAAGRSRRGGSTGTGASAATPAARARRASRPARSPRQLRANAEQRQDRREPRARQARLARHRRRDRPQRGSATRAAGIVVTREQTYTDGRADLGGARYRVYLVRLDARRATAGR